MNVASVGSQVIVSAIRFHSTHSILHVVQDVNAKQHPAERIGQNYLCERAACISALHFAVELSLPWTDCSLVNGSRGGKCSTRGVTGFSSHEHSIAQSN